MRPKRWAIFFLVVMFASLVGMGAAIPGDLPLGLVSAFALLISFLGLAFTGLVALIHWIQLGRRPAYGMPSVTKLGEVVRSDSERRIADYFTGNGIRYQYEKPAMNRWGLKRISRPDFYLPDYGVYVEYWGLVGADGGCEKRMARKTVLYLRSGVRVVSLYPGDLRDLGSALGSKLGRVQGGAAERR